MHHLKSSHVLKNISLLALCTVNDNKSVRSKGKLIHMLQVWECLYSLKIYLSRGIGSFTESEICQKWYSILCHGIHISWVWRNFKPLFFCLICTGWLLIFLLLHSVTMEMRGTSLFWVEHELNKKLQIEITRHLCSSGVHGKTYVIWRVKSHLSR